MEIVKLGQVREDPPSKPLHIIMFDVFLYLGQFSQNFQIILQNILKLLISNYFVKILERLSRKFPFFEREREILAKSKILQKR